MSRENVDLIRWGYSQVISGNLDAGLSKVSEDFEFDSLWGIYHGHAGLREWSSDMREAFAGYDLALEEVSAVDADRVLAVVRVCGRGSSSGVPVRQELATVWTVHEGQVIQAVSYPSVAKALDAVGERR